MSRLSVCLALSGNSVISLARTSVFVPTGSIIAVHAIVRYVVICQNIAEKLAVSHFVGEQLFEHALVDSVYFANVLLNGMIDILGVILIYCLGRCEFGKDLTQFLTHIVVLHFDLLDQLLATMLTKA